jgi:hypothetical protein
MPWLLGSLEIEYIQICQVPGQNFRPVSTDVQLANKEVKLTNSSDGSRHLSKVATATAKAEYVEGGEIVGGIEGGVE